MLFRNHQQIIRSLEGKIRQHP